LRTDLHIFKKIRAEKIRHRKELTLNEREGVEEGLISSESSQGPKPYSGKEGGVVLDRNLERRRSAKGEEEKTSCAGAHGGGEKRGGRERRRGWDTAIQKKKGEALLKQKSKKKGQ